MDLQVENIKVVDVIWYGDFGFVKGIDVVTNEIKIYAGSCTGAVSCSEAEDIKYIVKMGTKYTPEHFAGLLKWLEVE